MRPGPSLVFPVHLAEGKGGGADPEHLPSVATEAPAPKSSAAAGAAPAAAGGTNAPNPSSTAEPLPLAPPAGATARAFTNDPPDPAPLRQRDQYEYTLRFEDNAIRLVGVRAVRFPQPIVTARRMGRYALELWIGRELIERVRFDFPLLAAVPEGNGTHHSLYETPALTGGPYTVTVLVPASERARSARLVDRAARRQAELTWPPAPAGLGNVSPLNGPPGVTSPSGAVTSASGAVAPPSASATSPSSAAPAAARP